MNHHKCFKSKHETTKNDSLIGSSMKENVVDPWDAIFIDNIPVVNLPYVIEGSAYMGINGLIYLSCAKFASMIKGKNIDDLDSYFKTTFTRGLGTSNKKPESKSDEKKENTSNQ